MQTERPKRTEALRFRVTPAEKAWLEDVAHRSDRAVAQVIREALREYREKYWGDLNA